MFARYRKWLARRWLGILFLGSLIFCLCLGQLPPQVLVIAQSANPEQLVRQGVEQYQTGNYREAVQAWQQALVAYKQDSNQAAIVQENLARGYQELGQLNEAINYWERTIAHYRQAKDAQQVGRLLTEQSQTHIRLGQQRQAIALLCGQYQENTACNPNSALAIARSEQDRQGEAAALGSLGEAYRLRGNYRQAIDYLKQAAQIDHTVYQIAVANSLGNAYLSEGQLWSRRANSAKVRGANETAEEFQATATQNYQQSLNAYQNSLNLAQRQNNSLGQMRVLLNLLQLDTQVEDSDLANNTVDKALELLPTLPDTPEKVYGAIDIALSATDTTSPLTQCSQQGRLPEAERERLLEQAIDIAQTLQDSRSQSFALGALGHFYECRRDYQKALQFTQKALWAADRNLIAPDSLYLWEWQTGRILQVQGKRSEALEAYERAYTTLEKIRSDILVADRDLQLDFREVIEPLYRQLAQLKLELGVPPASSTETKQQAITESIRIIDSLKLAELQNYFGDDCVLTVTPEETTAQLPTWDRETAVFTPIIFADRTAVILSLPNGQQKLQWLEISSDTLKQKVQSFWLQLQEFYDPTDSFLTSAEDLYNSFIRPFSEDLASAKIKTLVFLQDGILRNIPMAALYDGQAFLVQKYAVATLPSLLVTSPKNSQMQNLGVLAVGLTESATIGEETYPPLINVGKEIEQVRNTFPNSKQLVNNQFTRENLGQELQQKVYPIIHIATHGQFGTIPEDTFLVTGNNKKLTMTDLESDIRRLSRRDEPLELLMLTACQTAVGDDRTTLGLAGITVQAGVKSAVASLWSIADSSTEELVAQFYNNLRAGINKAEALQKAQQTLIAQGEHPARWAPFVLIGNWR